MTSEEENASTSRLQDEIALLEAMYPEEVSFSEKSRELKYTSGAALLSIRLPQNYLVSGLPEVILAHDTYKNDMHDAMSSLIRELSSGEEILDAVLTGFQNIIVAQAEVREETPSSHAAETAKSQPQDCTMVVWLHHLLNTNKRKLALSPASAEVSGITKPGYPGLLLYTGPRAAVEEHVSELKSQNWQAFQVRLEEDIAWKLEHGRGVVEMESMKDVVKDVGVHKDVFLQAMRMK